MELCPDSIIISLEDHWWFYTTGRYLLMVIDYLGSCLYYAVYHGMQCGVHTFYKQSSARPLLKLWTKQEPFIQDYAVDWHVSLYVYPQYERCAILPILLYSSMLLAYFSTKFIGQFPFMSIVLWYGIDIKLVWNWADLLKHKHTAFGDSWFQATQLEPTWMASQTAWVVSCVVANSNYSDRNNLTMCKWPLLLCEYHIFWITYSIRGCLKRLGMADKAIKPRLHCISDQKLF